MLDVTFANDTNDVKVTISVATESKNMTKIAEALGETIVRVINGISGDDLVKNTMLSAEVSGMVQENGAEKIQKAAEEKGVEAGRLLAELAQKATIQKIKDKHEGENIKITVINVEDEDE